MRRQIIFRNSSKTYKREVSAQIDSEEKCLFRDFRMHRNYNGNLCLWQPIHNKPFDIMLFWDVASRTFEIVRSFMVLGFVNKEINENKHRRFTFTGPIKSVCGVVLRSLSVTFMTICCCISHRYAIKIRSISLIWWIVKMYGVTYTKSLKLSKNPTVCSM